MAAVGDVGQRGAMASPGNILREDGLRTWASRLEKIIGRPVARYTVEPKIDGLAIAATYADGKLVRVATRGDGRAGEDVTAQTRLVAGLPKKLKESVSIEVRGEVFMT